MYYFSKSVLLLFFVAFLKIATAQKMPDFIPYYSKGKWGYSDSLGNIVIQPQWNEAFWFKGDKAMVRISEENDKNGDLKKDIYCLIDSKGNYIIPPSRNWNGIWIGRDSTWLNAHNENKQYGLIDTNNNVIIPFEYRNQSYSADVILDSIRLLHKGDKLGGINDLNEIVIPFEFQAIRYQKFQDELYFFGYKDNKWFLYNKNMQLLFPNGYDFYEVQPNYYKHFNGIKIGNVFSCKCDSTKKYSLLGWIDLNNNTIIEPRFEKLHFYTDSIYLTHDRLYKLGNRKPLTKRYNTLYEHVNGDTLVGMKWLFQTSRFVNYKTTRYIDPTTAKIIDRKGRPQFYKFWKKYKPPVQSRSVGAPHPPHRYYGSEYRPIRIYIQDSLRYTFELEDITWSTQFRNFNGIATITGTQAKTNKTFTALISDSGIFKSPLYPLNSDYDRVIGFNIKDSIGVLRIYTNESKSPYYVAINKSGMRLGDPTLIPIFYAFYTSENELRYIINDHYDFSIYKTGNTQLSITDFFSRPVLEEAKIVDKDFNYIESFKPYTFKRFLDVNFDKVNDYTENIVIEDTNRNVAIANVKGSIQLPALAFQYKSIFKKSNYLYQVELDSSQHFPMLVNLNNQFIFHPKYKVYVNYDLKNGSTKNQHDIFYYNFMPFRLKFVDAPILQVYIKSGVKFDNQSGKTLYISYDGLIYADYDN